MTRTGRTPIFLIVALTALTLLSTAAAADLGQLTLDECIGIAMRQNHELEAAEMSIKKAEAVMTQARSAYYPQLKLQSRYMKWREPFRLENFDMTATMPTPTGPQKTTFTIDEFEITDDEMIVSEATAEMPIFTWWKITNINRLARRGYDIEQSRLEQVRNRIRANVITAYKTAVLAREARATLLETIGEMELFFKTAQQDFEKGSSNAPEKDILQIQYDMDDMRTWLPELNKWETLSLEALKISMGLDKVTPVDIVGDVLEYPEVQFDAADLVVRALESRPEMRILNQAIEAAGLQKKVAAVENLPMLGVFGQYQRTDDSFDPNQDDNWIIGVGATMHLFDGLRAYGKYKEAGYEAERLESQYRQARKGIAYQVKEKVTEIDQHAEQLEIRLQAQSKAVRQVQVVRQGYQYGLTAAEDVNEAQVQKRWADANVLFKKLEYVTAIAKLNEIVGEVVYSFE